MNKTVQINLGGHPFTVDDSAYRRLDLYLHELREYFKESDNSDEIMHDIESRLAELLNERVKARKIVTLQDIADTIRVMGRPGEFDDEPVTNQTNETGGSHTRPSGSWDIKTGKRLFRDPNDKVLGGVCSGLSAYFGIQDSIWMRIGFVVVTLTIGFGVLIYILLWALVPEARTAADRLAMRGEAANVNNIASMIERGLDDISDTIKDNWEDFRSKKKRHDVNAGTSDLRKTNSGRIPRLEEPDHNLELPDDKQQGRVSMSKFNRNFLV